MLITGKNGQVGWELQRSLLPLGHIVALDRHTLDLANDASISQVVRQIKPDVIVNAAAYTTVDKAEEDQDLAMQINGIAPGVLAEEAKQLRALLIHYSTDYVFDGTKQTPYIETDETKPINIYGSSKLAGELAIQAIVADHVILRTSWVYASRGNNFLLTMLKLMQERENLRIIADQTGTPTWARLIAETTAQIVKQSLMERQQETFQSGLYHLTSTGKTTWHGFAEKIKEIAHKQNKRDVMKIQNVAPISTAEYPTLAKRPQNSCMITNKLQQKYNLTMPSWDTALELCMDMP
ncbi:MAG: dTDP-4-dehydrorhamnose reductase [Desulfobacteraceae bacterium]|nr:dTDP-4-dehydrorhamnose reductase [Desulfobacteraceae bacterium]